MLTAFTFFGGLADVFLSLMLWYILDSDKAVFVLVEGDRVYAIREDVINPRYSGVNEDCRDEDEVDLSESHMSNRLSGVSKRMIEMFFTDEEGPDRDWSKYLYDDILL